MKTSTLILAIIGMILGLGLMTTIGSIFLIDPVPPSFTNGSSDLIERYDFNKDGGLDFEEYKIMYNDAYRGNLPPIDNMKKNFRIHDVNEDGILEDWELGSSQVGYSEVSWLNMAYRNG